MTRLEQGLILVVAVLLLWIWAQSVRNRRRAQQTAPPPPPPQKGRPHFRTLIWLCILALIGWAALRFVFAGQP